MTKPNLKTKKLTAAESMNMTPKQLKEWRKKTKHMDATDYLLASPANAKQLRESLKQAKKGKVVTFESVEQLKAFYDKPRKPVTPKQLKAWMDKHELTYRKAAPILCKCPSHINMMVKGKRDVSASISDSMKLYDLSKNICLHGELGYL